MKFKLNIESHPNYSSIIKNGMMRILIISFACLEIQNDEAAIQTSCGPEEGLTPLGYSAKTPNMSRVYLCGILINMLIFSLQSKQVHSLLD